MTWRKISTIFKGIFEEKKWFSECRGMENLECKGGDILAILKCGHKNFIGFVKNHSLDILYVFFGFVTHAYLAVILVSFFLQDYIPETMIHLADSLSEPYLGIIGIYLVLKEVRIRTGKLVPHRVFGEVFVAIWVILLLVSSLLTFVSESYHVDDVYRLIITNSLASVIIRIGTLFRY
ncbi:MAG: hypothetical protein A3G49_06905 [Candidatus Sungbacteria bacterium RIFCSPLOWO2_12_FULL_41_11]|uniref:Uncharacterized protein n=1 Tax=Candidatus Sungbacteria bacterium RIFCSPLOWO2_12_FULL_41_11 TaxID=1802286 RepID=A0A1G2LRS8_9BACT|nr:MAG: hypothetical protein UV01_C0012G0037 [Parcubacteria group bacterium GW2011_GWA2_42_14]OGY15733.1 MAG: hypothetical protein A3I52_01580 [Candidatus Blackburnbacteria bacterium RIFCSPLOWO2_02_FULL_40_10]OGZ97810.1 MAG: hypothetical protein A3D41_04750 [Candidatus Sungbacteria bacterium RIFCSPHIGHO2_02_FULL_41_12b]OHA14243.1 MAG: hypothetical protein A3G49_06905 [Candidatus Sungbacteria bacterium RIFCSPLOWO2_12_FULL_41_11]